jgi:hypothetical protein
LDVRLNNLRQVAHAGACRCLTATVMVSLTLG